MRAAVLLAACGGAGCTNLSYRPPAGGPPSPALAAAADGRVRLTDARPRWERRPFDDGYALADLDALRPDPWAAVRSEAEAAVGPAGGPTAAVVVQAFRVILADPVGLDAEREDSNRRWESSPADNDSVSTALLGGLFRGFLGDALLAKRYPAEVVKEGTGATCTLAAEVTITWPAGGRRTALVSAVRNADTPAVGSRRYWGDDTNGAVAAAAADFGRQLRELVQAGPGP